jgi:methionyl-tRNA formyltransferase
VAPARVVFYGSGAFAARVLDVVATGPGLALVGVVTAPPRPAGRRAVLTPTPVGVRAASLGVPVLFPDRLRDPGFVAALEALRPDVGILADYGKLLPGSVLEVPPHGTLNLHPSLLPRHRGATPIPAAILAGDHETGVSLFRMDAGMDTGPIVAVERIALTGDEDAPDLEGRLAGLAGSLVARSIGPYLRGEAPPRPQPAEGATVTRPLLRADGRLDPLRPAVALERQVRAYRPWPGTFLELTEGRLAVLEAAVAGAGEGDAAGVLMADGPGLALATATGRLVLLEVQPPGGRPMGAASFRRGHPAIVGARVG